MGKRRKNADEEDNGFAIWGGYMEAKRTKLMEQFSENTVKQVDKLSNIFKGVGILVNGYTKPNAEELKILMAQHGGAFHMYQISSTTHIIASNLPNVKINKLGNVPIVKPGWIEDSITFGRLLDYSKYLLYTNQSKTQPKLNFNVIPKNNKSSCILENENTNNFNSTSQSDFSDLNTLDNEGKQDNSEYFNFVNTKSGNLNNFNKVKAQNKLETDVNTNNCNDNSSNTINLKDVKSTKAQNNFESFNDVNTNSLNNCDNIGVENVSKIFNGTIKNNFTQSLDSFNKLENIIKAEHESHIQSLNKVESKPNGSKVTKTASDPKFLSEFYNNSRLHLISTLGAEFKQLVNDMREKSDWKFPGLERISKIKNMTSNQPIIMHIDMDCFFVSVGLRTRPELHGKPVAVTHSKGGQSRTNVDRQAEIAMYKERLPDGADFRLEAIDNTCSLSEIASCSYEARRCGIKNGMFMGAALKLCPELNAIPYDFQGYREVSNTLYRTLAEYTLDIEAVSCDEMYVDVTKILSKSGMGVLEWAEHIRGVIIERTGCPCSTGFGGNKLQARLATRKAKPNGAFYLKEADVEGYLMDTPLADLPGVGRATLVKLKSLGLETCGDVQMASTSLLKKELGVKVGETIAEQARGIDKKPLKYEHERKSVSAEVNYGIRFKTNEEALKFFESLSHEVKTRLKDVNMKAKCITLKVMVRAQDAPTETAKYLGHGVCDSLSRSSTLNSATDDVQIILKEVKNLYEKLALPFEDLRGVGIQLSRLEKEAVMNNVLKNFLSKENVKRTQINKKNPEFEIHKHGVNVKEKRNEEIVITNGNRKISPTESMTSQGTSVETFTNGDVNIKEIKIKQNISAEIIVNPDVNITVKKNNSEGPNKIKHSGRGRPKGSKNSKSVTKSNNVANVTDYFKCTQKSRPAKSQNLSNINPPMNIDMNVLEQLPPDIRTEVINEYKLNLSSKSQIKNETSPISMQIPTKPGSSKEKSSDDISKPKENKSGFETMTKDNFKTMLYNWVHSRPKPHHVDVTMLGNHLKKMATSRRIDELHVLLKYLYRVIEEKDDCIWHGVYFQIIQLVQQGMISRYSGKILVPKQFNCESC